MLLIHLPLDSSNQIFVPNTCCHSPICLGLYLSLLELSPRHGKVVCITQCFARLRRTGSIVDFVAVHARVLRLNLLATSNWTHPATAGLTIQQLSIALLTSLALASRKRRVVRVVVDGFGSEFSRGMTSSVKMWGVAWHFLRRDDYIRNIYSICNDVTYIYIYVYEFHSLTRFVSVVVCGSLLFSNL